MDETPDRPTRPLGDGLPDSPPAAGGGTPPTEPPTEPPHEPPTEPPTEPPGGPPTDRPTPAAATATETGAAGTAFTPLSPLDDLDGDDDAKRRRLTPVRLAVAAIAVAVVAGLGFAVLGGGDDGDGDGDDAVASIDGSGDDEDTGEDDGGGGGGGGAPDEGEFQDAMLDFARCMREHGIDMPDPEFDGEGGGVMIGGRPAEPGTGPSEDEMAAAHEACQPIMDEVAPDIQLTPEEQAQMQDDMLAMADCMRGKGWDEPDPTVNEDGSVVVRGGPEDRTGGKAPTPENQEEHQADMEACNEELGIDAGGPGAVRGGS